MPGPAVRRQIGGRGGGGEALPARADGDRDHVLFKSFVVADAGVAAGGEQVHETVFDHDLELDVGIGLQEGRDEERAPGARR